MIFHRPFRNPVLVFTLCFWGSTHLAQGLEDLLRQAEERIRADDAAAAESLLRQALDLFGDDPALLSSLGRLYQNQSKYRESIVVLQKLLRRAPVYPEANLAIGVSHYALGEFDAAIEALQKELVGNPKSRETRYYLALSLDASHRKLEAIEQLETLLKDSPQDAQALYQLVRTYKAGTLQAFQRLTRLAPESDFVLALRAEINADNNRLNEAVDGYRRVAKTNPNFPGIHFALGETYWRMAKSDEAMQELKLALREDPSDALANYYVADLLVKEQRISEAIEHLRTSVKGNPKLMEAHFLLGKTLLAQGDAQESLKHLQAAASLDPLHKPSHYQLSQAYARLNNAQKSREHLETFERLTRQSKEDMEEKLRAAPSPGADK